jgi:hypothetical protein
VGLVSIWLAFTFIVYNLCGLCAGAIVAVVVGVPAYWAINRLGKVQ